MAMLAIDVWAQPALKGEFTHLPEVKRLLKQSGTAAMVERGMTAAEMVEAMDAAGLDKVLLSVWHMPGGWVISNDEVARIVEEYPDRFVGVATVDLERPMEAIHELECAVGVLGFKALCVVPWLWNRPPNDRLYYLLYAKCIELGIPFCAQVGHIGLLMPSETGRPVAYLDQVALDVPELKIVAGHIGFPWTGEMIGLAWKHENVYIDTSAYLPRCYPPQLLRYLKTYGHEKVMFGTNFPRLPFGKCQALELDLPEDIRAVCGNAARVFGL